LKPRSTVSYSAWEGGRGGEEEKAGNMTSYDMSRFSSVLKTRPVIASHIKLCLVLSACVSTHPIRGHIIMWTEITVLKERNANIQQVVCSRILAAHFSIQIVSGLQLIGGCLYARRRAIRLILFPCRFQGRTDKKAHYGRAIFYIPADPDYAYYNN